MFLTDLSTTLHIGTKINWPGLHLEVVRTPPVVPGHPREGRLRVQPASATGTALLLTGIVSGLALRLRPGEIGRVFLGTLHRVRFSLLTIAAMLALGYVTRYGGLDASMGLAFARTGMLFPFFSPLLGWLGVALTGSDTSSNALFGNLQKITATQIGISPILAAASNSSGGVMGKMIDAQSIVVAGVATGQQGEEGEILRYVFFHSSRWPAGGPAGAGPGVPVPGGGALAAGQAASARSSSTIVARPFKHNGGRHQIAEVRLGDQGLRHARHGRPVCQRHRARPAVRTPARMSDTPINCLAQMMPSAGRTRSAATPTAIKASPVRSQAR